MQDKELIELCKQVYETTEWGRMDNGTSADLYIRHGEIVDWTSFGSAGMLNAALKRGWAIPLYTSDYLLEKLPPTIELQKQGFSRYSASFPNHLGGLTLSDTPLKALLELVLVLKGAG